MKRHSSLYIVIGMLAFAIIALVLYQWLYEGPEPIQPVTGSKFLMSTLVTQQIYDSDQALAQDVLDEAYVIMEGYENALSLYVEDSYISLINQQAGRDYVQVPGDVFDLLSLSYNYGRLSAGVFDITIAPVTLAWGIHSSSPRIPGGEELAELSALVNYQDILFREEDRAVMLAREGMMVDLGAIAKGALCDVIRERLTPYGFQGYILSVGGNILAMGQPQENKNHFSIGIRNPRGSESSIIGYLDITDVIISTSGDYERYFESNGVRYHHIFDPSTASPAQTDLISVSIICQSGSEAEFLSTYLFVMGKEHLLALEERGENEHFDFIAVDTDYNVYISKRLKDIFTPNDSLKEFTFIYV